MVEQVRLGEDGPVVYAWAMLRVTASDHRSAKNSNYQVLDSARVAEIYLCITTEPTRSGEYASSSNRADQIQLIRLPAALVQSATQALHSHATGAANGGGSKRFRVSAPRLERRGP